MKNFTELLLLSVLSVLLIHQCFVTSNNKSVYQKNTTVLLDSVSYYKNKIGLEVAEKLAFQGTAKDLETYLDAEKLKSKQLSIALEKFKKLASVTKTETIVEIKEVPIPFKVQVPCNFERTFLKVDPFYTFSGTVNQTGVFLEALTIPNTQTVVVGKKKISLFKSEFSAEVTNSNPFIKTTEINNFTFTEKEKRFGIGVSVGFGMYQNGFFVGPSINYNFIKF